MMSSKNTHHFVKAKFSEIAGQLQKCKSYNWEQGTSKVRAIFLTFPYEKNTFQWSKVVSEAIFSISYGYASIEKWS